MDPYFSKYRTKRDIEHMLLEISSFLKNEDHIKASDRLLGPGATRRMWLARQDELARQYSELIESGTVYKNPPVEWQHEYDLR